MIPIIAVIGNSGSGKTTLIERLVSRLSGEGLRVGTIKHIHKPGFSIDTKGKDSWRHSQAGAKIVVCYAPEEIAVIRKRDPSHKDLGEIIDLVKGEELDLLVLEGFRSVVAKRKDIFKIVTARDRAELEMTLDGVVAPVLAITGPCAGGKVVPRGIKIPIIDLERDVEKIIGLVRKVASGRKG